MIRSSARSGLVLWRTPVPPPPTAAPVRLPRGSAASWAVGLVLLVLIETRHAAADLIEQYLPTAVASLASGPGVTVLSRSHPDYDALGMKLGSFVVRPSASESAGYDSNPSGLAHARGSPMFDTQAALRAASNWSRHSLSATLTVDDTRYPDAKQDNTTNWSASVAGTFDIGRDQASWSLAHYGLNQSPRALDNPGLAQAIPYTVDDARLAYRINFNRLSIEPAVDYVTYRFTGDTVGIASQSYRDRDLLQPSLTARYELAPLRNLVAVVRGTDIEYLSSLPGQARRNSTGFSLLAGIELGNGIWQSRLLAGYQQRNYASSQYGTIAAPIIEGSVAWTPDRATTYTARLTRSIQDAADEAIAAYTLTEADAIVDYEFRRNVLLHAQTSVQVANYAQGGGTTTQLGATIGATWLMNRAMALSGSYSYTNSRSDNHTEQGNSYTDSVALLRLGLKL